MEVWVDMFEVRDMDSVVRIWERHVCMVKKEIGLSLGYWLGGEECRHPGKIHCWNTLSRAGVHNSRRELIHWVGFREEP